MTNKNGRQSGGQSESEQRGAAPTELYHITPRFNSTSVEEHGLSPSFSRCRRPAVYYVEARAIVWAAAHVSQRYGVSVDDLNVYAVRFHSDVFTRHNRAIWYTPFTLRPERRPGMLRGALRRFEREGRQ